MDRLPCPRDHLRLRVELEICHSDLRAESKGVMFTSKMCIDTSQKLLEGKRFYDVVIGSDIESLDSSLDIIHRRHHDDGSPRSLLTKLATERRTIFAWEHPIEKNKIIWSDTTCDIIGLHAVMKNIDRKRLVSKVFCDIGSYLMIIFDE